MATAATEAGASRRSRVWRGASIRWLVPAALLFIYVAQCAWFVRTQSFTFDEPLHLYAGLDAWRNHRFQFWNDHPPLARLLLTLPLLNSKWQVEAIEHADGSDEVLSVRPDPVSMAERARAMNVGLGVVLGALLWLAARRWWSEGAANFALALFAFSPATIAHFSVATTDGMGALAIFATAGQLLRWRHNPARGQTALLGLVLGLLLLAKFYTPPFFLVTLALMLVLKPDGWEWRPGRWNWGAAVSVAVIAGVVLWAGYFFHTSHVTVRDGTLVATYPHRPPLVKRMAGAVSLNLWVPAGEYIDGLRAVKYHNHLGHPSFFLGHISRGGWRSYYPVLILLKWPVVIILLFAVTVVLLAWGKLRLPADFRLLVIYPLMMLAMAITARIQIGERHLLPAYSFVLLFCAGTWEFARARRKRVTQAILVAAVAVNMADTLRYAPDYLAYFNFFVPSSRSWRLLSDSNLDWGQGLIALRQYEQQHSGEQVHLAYFGSVHPEVYGIRALPLPPDTPTSGTIVVSATELSGQYLQSAGAYHWVLRYPLKTILAHSLYVFEVPGPASGAQREARGEAPQCVQISPRVGPVTRRIISTTSAISSSRWMRPPSRWSPHPRAHRTSRIANSVHNIV